MRRIGRLVIIVLVTPYACTWGVVIVTVVTGDTLICDDGVRTGKYIILIVDIK